MMTRLTRSLLFLVALGVPSCALGNIITLTFDEFGTAVAVDANGVSISGITFGFTGGTATYNGMIGGGTQNLSDPVLTGDTTGVLTLSFAAPTTVVDFDIALQSIAPIAGAYHVDLASHGSTVLSQDYDTDSLVLYSEGSFAYSGAPVDSATVTFYHGMDPFGSDNVTTFAIDNLTFNSPSGVPEPGTLGLTIAGLLLAVKFGIRRSVS